MNLAVGDTLLAPRQLGELAVDVVFLRDDAFFDLHDRVAPFAQLRFELGAQLDRLLACFDRRLSSRRVCFAASLVEQLRARAACGLEPRGGEQSEHE